MSIDEKKLINYCKIGFRMSGYREIEIEKLDSCVETLKEVVEGKKSRIKALNDLTKLGMKPNVAERVVNKV